MLESAVTRSTLAAHRISRFSYESVNIRLTDAILFCLLAPILLQVRPLLILNVTIHRFSQYVVDRAPLCFGHFLDLDPKALRKTQTLVFARCHSSILSLFATTSYG